MEATEVEIQKLIGSGFIHEEEHLDWMANIVPVTKKKENVRVYFDFKDLNEAFSKDEILVSVTYD